MTSQRFGGANRQLRQCNPNPNSKHTNTPAELSFCKRCQLAKAADEVSNTSSTTIINDYMHSLQYINSCHTLINELIKRRQPASNICMPEMPNFLNILTYIAKDVRDLSELKTLNELTTLMSSVHGGSKSSNCPTQACGQSSHSNCCSVDKEVETARPFAYDAETCMKKGGKPVEVRSTGIPRRIKEPEKIECAPERQASPVSLSGSQSDVSPLSVRPSSAVTAFPVAVNDIAPAVMPNVALHSDVGELSDKESAAFSNDETDEYAKDILLATGSVNSSGSNPHSQRPKVRKVKSKTRRDIEMIQNFLKQWGMEVPIDSESVEEIRLPRSNAEAGDAPSTIKSSVTETEVTSDDSVTVEATTMMQRPAAVKKNSKQSVKAPRPSNDSQTELNVFNDIAATAEGLESTFITNEMPAWQQSPTSPYGMDESDIEPDSDQKSIKSKHVQIVRVSPRAGRTVTYQANATAAYVVTQKPKDSFLMPRRRHSHSDVGSEHNMMALSDIDDAAFDKKRRPRTALKVRQPVLPQKVLSNIGILTRTGKIKPEKERQLQELRSRLSSDMQTALFRKPRNRKLETDDIVYLQADSVSSKKK